MTEWCLQTGLTKPQHTRCQSIENNGDTCINPEIKYGTSPVGIPKEHSNNDYNKWCEQLGGIYESHATGTRTGYALYGNTSCGDNDNGQKHWCDWDDSRWYNGSLGYHGTYDNFITSVTCRKRH